MISISKSAIAFANRLGGYSVYDFDKPTTKALKIKFERAGRLAEDYALTADKVKKLEMATLGFAQTVVEAAKVTKETTTTK